MGEDVNKWFDTNYHCIGPDVAHHRAPKGFLRMKTRMDLFRDFSEMSDRVALSLLDGRSLEGYILQTTEEKFAFGFGGPMAPEEPTWFDIEDVDFGSLAFFSASRRRYMDARWNGEAWELSPSSPVG